MAITHELATIERDGQTIQLTREEMCAIYQQIERERTIGYVYDLLHMLEIEPTEELPLAAYVNAYACEEDRYGTYISDETRDYYRDVFNDPDAMARYARSADPGDNFKWWEAYGER